LRIQELDSDKKNLEKGFIEVRSERKNVKVYYDSILFIESLSDYLKFVLDTGEIISREKISHIEKLLPSTFLRCHRSFIVNTEKILAFNYDYIEISENEIPISRSYKKMVMNRLKK
jgi:DNA-binding LytR/AlgR family response regulator